MSDTVIKGAKRTASRPAPHSSSSKSSAKGRKLTAKSAKPKPKRSAEKAPVRKAAPAKSASNAKSARPTSKPTKKPTKRPAAKPKATKHAVSKTRAATPSKAKSSTKRPEAKPKPHKPAPAKAAAKTAKAQTTKPVPPRPATRPTPAPPRQPSRDEAAALKSFERAHKEFARAHFGTARDLFRSLIDQHAGVSEVTARARIYLAIAETRLRSEASLPRDPDSLYDRGVIELNRGDFVSAQELFERALKRDPDAADTHYALAASRARLGSVEPALQSLERAVELKPVLRVRAQSDADLVALRNDPEFERIVFSNSRA
jgi:tetratricopeptide (TPR) repeat protein